jgi:hypothetical protein
MLKYLRIGVTALSLTACVLDRLGFRFSLRTLLIAPTLGCGEG